jgi:DNA-binding transcriptional ArsR family regulator
MDATQLDRVSTLFKALADPARLRILGLLAEQPLAGHELASRLGLTPPTISHHMRRLTDAELVDVSPNAQSRIYSLRSETLRNLTRDSLPESSSPDEKADTNSVLRAFFDGPRLRQIPASRKKRVVVLRHLLAQFEPGKDYPEKRVNQILQMAHEDFATLRRELVDYGFLTRDRGIYRVSKELPQRGLTVQQEVGDESRWFAELVTRAVARAVASSGSPTRETPPLPHG